MKQLSDASKVALLLLALALPAVARGPIIVPFPFTSLTLQTASVCGFDLRLTPQAGTPNKEKLIIFGNTGLLTGPLFITLENLTTHKTVNLNASGPVQITLIEGGESIVLLGPGLLSYLPLPADVAAAAGLPRVPYLHGRIVLQIDAGSNVTSIQSFTGKVENLCELMQ
jgi:hypothetical protein